MYLCSYFISLSLCSIEPTLMMSLTDAGGVRLAVAAAAAAAAVARSIAAFLMSGASGRASAAAKPTVEQAAFAT